MNKTAIAQMHQGYRPMRTSTDLSGEAIVARRVAAAPDLQPYVMEFWEYRVSPQHDYLPVQVFPNGCLSIRFNIKADEVEAVLYGPSLVNRMKGLFYSDWTIFGAALWPSHAYQLLGLSLDEIRDLRIHLDCIWPRTTERLCRQMFETQSMHDRIDLLSGFLRATLRDKPPKADFLNAYYQLVAGAPLATDIGFIAQQTGTTGRSLRRNFNKYLGLGPKQMQRLIRVQTALKALSAQPQTNLATLALDSGFSDQAHFSRCFQEFVGVAPTRFVQLVGNMQDKSLDIWSGMDPGYKHHKSPKVVRFV